MRDLVISSGVVVSADVRLRFQVMASGAPPSGWDLIPVEDLNAVIASIEPVLSQRCDQSGAAKLAEFLLGCYPRNDVDNPEIYSRGIVSVLMKFPPSVGAQAVDQVTLETKFVPRRSEVYEACEAQLAKIKTTLILSKRMLEEHENRKKAKAEAEELAANRKAFREKHGDKSIIQVLKEQGKWVDFSTTKEEKNGKRNSDEGSHEIDQADGSGGLQERDGSLESGGSTQGDRD